MCLTAWGSIFPSPRVQDFCSFDFYLLAGKCVKSGRSLPLLSHKPQAKIHHLPFLVFLPPLCPQHLNFCAVALRTRSVSLNLYPHCGCIGNFVHRRSRGENVLGQGPFSKLLTIPYMTVEEWGMSVTGILPSSCVLEGCFGGVLEEQHRIQMVVSLLTLCLLFFRNHLWYPSDRDLLP